VRIRCDYFKLGGVAEVSSLDWRLRLLLLADRGPAPADPTPAQARAAFNAQLRLLRPIATGSGPQLHEERALQLAGDLGARLYRPAPGRLPAIVHFHGGGWVVGDLRSHQPFCRALAKATGAVVIDVDYRLAPEHPSPAALDDCLSALKSVVLQASALDLDETRIALAGDSAGGHLALSTALASRGRTPLRALALFYPAVGHEFSTHSYHAYATGYGLTAQRMRWYWQQYGGPAIGDELKGLPPTLVVTAQFDVLHDDGVALNKRLLACGVDSQLLEVPGVIHGYLVMQRLLPQARATLRSIAAHLTENLAPGL
jgi:acetyl esterase